MKLGRTFGKNKKIDRISAKEPPHKIHTIRASKIAEIRVLTDISLLQC